MSVQRSPQPLKSLAGSTAGLTAHALRQPDVIGPERRDVSEQEQGTISRPEGCLLDRLPEKVASAFSQRCLLKDILDASNEGVAVLDAEGKVLFWNAAMAQLTGYADQEAMGRPHWEVMQALSPAWEGAHIPSKLTGPNDSWWRAGKRDVTLHHRDGRETWAQLTITPQLDVNGRPSIVVLALSEAASTELERLKDEFISLASHELRTPLTSIKGYASLLLRSGRFDARLLEVIIQQSNHLHRLLKDMLRVSRLQTGHLQVCATPFSLAELAGDVLERFTELQSDHRYSLEVSDGLPLVRADRDLTEGVLSDLLENAVSYSPTGSLVKVSVRRLEPTEGVSSDSASGSWLRVSVSDEGIGILPEDMPHLFERFYRASADQVQQVAGVGLGLFRVKEIVERHGGRVWVESTPRAGSTFHFTLPCVGPTEDAPTQAHGPL